MRQEESVVARGPFQDFLISFAYRTGILHANDIECWQESEQTAHNAVVKVFVNRKAKHVLTFRVALNEAFAKTRRIGPRFVELTNSVVFFLLLFQVIVNRNAVLQVIANRCVDIGKRQRRVLLKNFLCRRALIKGVHDGIQTNAGATYTDNSVFVGEQWCWISRNLQGHACILPRGPVRAFRH